MIKKEKTLIRRILYNLTILPFFLITGIISTLLTKFIFEFFQFMFIGIIIQIGLFLFTILPYKFKDTARKITQLILGIYLFTGLGIIFKLNVQIEGFWFDILFGVFYAPFFHYITAKLIGPLFTNRLFCGWACWTAIILDLLPFKKNTGRINKKLGYIRYIHFFVSILVVLSAWFIFGYKNMEYHSTFNIQWFIIGNLIYYISGIIIAFILKDNRAFCKYLCPIVVFLKTGARFSILKIKGSKINCNGCGECENNCPMNINITGYIKNSKRILSTECILCLKCIYACKNNNLRISYGFDIGIKELLKIKNNKNSSNDYNKFN